MSNDERSRTYPTRPYLAVSAAIFRDGRVLIVRRARPPAHGLYTLPGGGVELGETLEEAVIREVREETSLDVEPVALAGYRQAIARDAAGGVERHFVILPFAARWISARLRSTRNWPKPIGANRRRLSDLKTTEGLALDRQRRLGADRGSALSACLNHAALSCLLDRPLDLYVCAADASNIDRAVVCAVPRRRAGRRAILPVRPAAAAALSTVSSTVSAQTAGPGPAETRAAAAGQGPAPGAPQSAAPVAPQIVSAPYDHDLQRLSEILGALHFLRGICGSNEGQKWRNEAQALIDAEAPTGDRHDQMVASFNRGYRGFQQSYRSCTPAAGVVIRRYLEEGAHIAREITARYAN